MTYCSTDDVYRTAGITSTEIPVANVEEFILDAEAYVDRLTNTTYWSVPSDGTITGVGTTTLTDSSQSWTASSYDSDYVWVYGSSTTADQVRQVSTNSATSITIGSVWDTTPSIGETYRVIQTGSDPYNDEYRDGKDTDTLFLDHYPLHLLESVTSNGLSVTASTIFEYAETGKLVLSDTSSVSTWTSSKARKNRIKYWHGVYPVPREVKRLTMVLAGMTCLEAQMGGTHNTPSGYTLPEGSVQIGQAYVNIRTTWDTLNKEKDMLVERVIKYVSVFA